MPEPPHRRAVAAMLRHPRRAVGLGLSCHPLPTVAVTALSAGLALLADNSAARSVLLIATVLAGQLSIGWSNDWLDAARDKQSRRTDKPAASGAVPVGVVARAAVVALAASLLGSVPLGWRAGGAALVLLACGWLYNVGVKATAWSWLMYALGFGALPAAATLNGPGSHWPAWWAIGAGATLGVAAHLANALPDLATDRRSGIRGLPHRLGARRTALGSPLLLTGATALIVFGPRAAVSWAGWCALAISAAVAAVAVRAAVAGEHGRRYFLATVGVAVLDLALFGVSGGKLT